MLQALIDQVTFDDKGLVLAIVQDVTTLEVLMAAYMNAETLAETLSGGTMVYWSRSRQARWHKGDTSGHYQSVKEVYIDCDGDSLLFKVSQAGCACHEGYFSCFFRKYDGADWQVVRKKI